MFKATRNSLVSATRDVWNCYTNSACGETHLRFRDDVIVARRYIFGLHTLFAITIPNNGDVKSVHLGFAMATVALPSGY